MAAGVCSSAPQPQTALFLDLGSILLATALGWSMREAIASPYVTTVVRMEQLAAGDMDSPIQFTSHQDCIGRMTKAMQVFRDAAVASFTQGCLGLYNTEQQALMKRLVELITYAGAVPGIQINHAGRKASSKRPWEGGTALPREEGGWVPDAISAISFQPGAATPHAMTVEELRKVVAAFAASTRRAHEAASRVVEVLSAHGYLLHSALSPLSNTRNDAYGGDLTGRARLLMEVLDAVCGEWPGNLPLSVRLSCTDWAEGGFSIDEAVQLTRWLKASGDVDLIDCSSGGITPGVRIPSIHPGYQVPIAERLKRRPASPPAPST